MQELIASKYLQIVSRKKDYAVYHSLLGNLLIIDSAGKRVLESFLTPNSVENAKKSFRKYAPTTIWSFINDLRLRKFIVADHLSESRIIEQDRARREKYLDSGYLIRGLQLITSNTCNFSCEYCFVKDMYASKERAKLQKSPANMQMKISTAYKAVNTIIELLASNGNRELQIEFFGGEPLMNWPVIESVLNTFKNGNVGGVKINYSVTTNGHLITEKIAKILKRYGVTVTVSFDAPGKIERQLTNKEKGSERVVRNLKILAKTGNWVTFNSVLSKSTLHDYNGRALVDMAKNLNIGMIGLILDLDLDFYKSRENKEKVINEVFDTFIYGRSQGIPIVGYWHQVFNQIIGEQYINLISGYKTCPATGCKLSVEPDGNVFICKCCSGHLGHISDLDQVLSSKQYSKYAMRAYRNSSDCKGCEIEGFCSGVCMGALEKKYGDLEVIEKSSCNVFKKLTKKLIKNVSEQEVDVNYLDRQS